MSTAERTHARRTRGSASQRWGRRAAVVSATAVSAFIVAVTGTAAARPASRLAGPPATFFSQGHNLCRAASLAAVRKAGGQHYKAGLFAGRVCNWERSDLKAGITLSTHPPAIGATLMRQFLSESGSNGITAKSLSIPGASKAVLVTLPAPTPGQVSKDLFATYSHGVVQVNMTAPGSLPDSRLIAVMRLIAAD